MKNIEIERRYVVIDVPTEDIEATVVDTYVIKQYYISNNPLVRVRSSTNKTTNLTEYVLTIKGPGTVTRVEVNTVISKEDFLSLKNLSDRRVIKVRELIECHENTWEVDTMINCGDDYIEAMIAEIELKSE